MKRIAHKTALHLGGWACIAAGLLGLIMPIIPGIILIVAGVYIISLSSLWLFNKIELIKVRFPTFGFHFNKIDTAIGKYIKKAH